MRVTDHARLASVLAPTARPVAKEGRVRFFELPQSFLDRAKEGPVRLLFLGDSITELWYRAPPIWEHDYGQYQPSLTHARQHDTR